MKRRGKKAQQIMGMSFGVIFSIFLIIFIIVVAGIVINVFLKSQRCAQIGIFLQDFQAEIDSAWNSQSISTEFQGRLPSKLDFVCFANLSERLDDGSIGMDISLFEGTESNLFFYPVENSCNLPNHRINHVDLSQITWRENPYCIPISDGEIIIKVEKQINEKLVRIG